MSNAAASPTPVLQLIGITRIYRQGSGQPLTVLRGVDLTLWPGELVALVGSSGSGKSTLLHQAGLLEKPDAGRILLQGQEVGVAQDRERTRLRREKMGYVYQFHHLLPEFTALENVLIPQILAGRPRAEARDRAEALLAAVGLKDRLSHRPALLSGGEQQRVAIARALANQPVLLLADEPTGNLDPKTSEVVFGILSALARQAQLCCLIATHNLDLASRMDRVLRLQDGVLQGPIPSR